MKSHKSLFRALVLVCVVLLAVCIWLFGYYLGAQEGHFSEPAKAIPYSSEAPSELLITSEAAFNMLLDDASHVCYVDSFFYYVDESEVSVWDVLSQFGGDWATGGLDTLRMHEFVNGWQAAGTIDANYYMDVFYQDSVLFIPNVYIKNSEPCLEVPNNLTLTDTPWSHMQQYHGGDWADKPQEWLTDATLADGSLIASGHDSGVQTWTIVYHEGFLLKFVEIIPDPVPYSLDIRA